MVAVVCCLAITAAVSGLAVGTADASASASEKKVDIVFVVDSSKSMNTVRYELARDIGVLRQQLEGEGIDARYGLVSYGRTATVRQQLTSDYDEFDRAMNFETGGNVENASRAILKAAGMDFRPDAERVIVLVTNEDDDSSPSVRQRAFAALSKTHFITVSHDTVGESSCRLHSEPCDNSTANEPTRMAEAVGGDWIDVTRKRAAILEEIGEIVTAEILDVPTADTGGDGATSEDTAAESGSPNVEVQSITTNESSIEVGERVRVTVQVANSGPVPGEFEAYVHVKDSPDDFGFGVVGTRSIEVPAEGSRAVTFTTTFDGVGDYYLYTSGSSTTVSVVERQATTVRTVVNETSVTASVSDPEPGQPVDITFESVPLGVSETGANGADENGSSGDESDATANASVRSGREESVGTLNLVRVTPTTERDFTVTVDRRRVGGNGSLGLGTDTAPLPTGVEPISVLSLDSSVPASAFETVTLEYTVDSEATRLYRYDAATDAWKPVQISSVNRTTGESRRVVAQTGGSTLFAVVEAQPVFEVVNATVEREQVTAGEQFQTTVTVRNTGLANGSYTAELTVDGETVATGTVRVAANTTETLVFNYRPQTAGEYTVSVNGTVAGTVTVTAAESGSDESSGTATDTQTVTATATQTATATATATASATATATDSSSDDSSSTAAQTATEPSTTTAPAATDSLSGDATAGSAPGFTSTSLTLAVLVLSILSLWRRR